ncbi:peptidoglycan recognition family protein [Neptunicella sp. SCSIO 80796]|uniref:peptidoglycan recognition protein family protein n=1 Tax=Neptunicella plasticusilytica TaxID=3117012 RepID=UPI003A4D4072
MPDIDSIITALTVAAGFSLLVERIVEFLKHVIDGANAHQVKTQAIQQSSLMPEKAKVALKKYHGLLDNLEDKTAQLSPLIDLNADKYQQALFSSHSDGEFGDLNERYFEKTSAIALKQIQSPSLADLNRARLSLFYLLSAFGFSVVLASVMDLHLLSMLMLKEFNQLSSGLKVADHILTGMVIAGGAQPIHLLITFLTSRKMSEAEKLAVHIDSQQEEQQTLPPEVVNNIQQKMQPVMLNDTSLWLPIDYRGGVNPETLQNRNLRQGDPSLIVYHHTAMPSQLGFKAIVDEFLISKKWSTGYHCVIMPDGSIKPFCRWDRVGNHTKGHNNRSLGIAFHGNFHLAEGDKYSNIDGRYGNQQPTELQLTAGARIIALWTHIYPLIHLDFHTHILPHCDVLAGQTVCPGSHFPHKQLSTQVQHFYQQWLHNEQVLQQIALFKNNPYLYVQETQ